MRAPHTDGWTRRRFLDGLTWAGTVGLLGLRPRWVAAAPPPESSTLRIGQRPAICFAPPDGAAAQLFQAEGCVDVPYGKRPVALATIVSGAADFTASDVGSMIAGLATGEPMVVLAGLPRGCYEPFGTAQIRSIWDLAGQKVATSGLHSPRHRRLSAMLAYVGVEPRRDIDWVTQPAGESMQRRAAGQSMLFKARRALGLIDGVEYLRHSRRVFVVGRRS